MADFRVIMTLVFKGRSYREIEVYQGSWTGPREWRGCPHVNESAAL